MILLRHKNRQKYYASYQPHKLQSLKVKIQLQKLWKIRKTPKKERENNKRSNLLCEEAIESKSPYETPMAPKAIEIGQNSLLNFRPSKWYYFPKFKINNQNWAEVNSRLARVVLVHFKPYNGVYEPFIIFRLLYAFLPFPSLRKQLHSRKIDHFIAKEAWKMALLRLNG